VVFLSGSESMEVLSLFVYFCMVVGDPIIRRGNRDLPMPPMMDDPEPEEEPEPEPEPEPKKDGSSQPKMKKPR
jgi:hypothetical protein